MYFHKLGTSQDADVLIYERPEDKDMFVGGGVSDDGKYLIISVGKGTSPNNMVYYKDLSKEDSSIMPLVDKLENNYSFLDNIGTMFYFQTDKDAPRARIVAVDITDKDKKWREIVPQAAEPISGVGFVNNQFAVSYLKDAYTQFKIFDKDGKFVRNVELPGIGSAGGFGGKRTDTETFYSFNSFTTAPDDFPIRYENRQIGSVPQIGSEI